MLFGLLCVSALAAAENASPVWVKRNPNPTSAQLTTIAYGAGKYIVVGTDDYAVRVFSSIDALNWREVASFWPHDLIGPELAEILYSVFYDERIGFIALSSVDYGNPPAILTSTDGLKWSVNRTDVVMKGIVAVGNGVVVSVTGRYFEAISVSTNGVNYTSTDARASSYITFMDGQFLNLGLDLVVMASRDGVSWSPRFNLTAIIPSPPAGQGAYVISMARAQSGPLAALVRLEGDERRTFLARSDDGGRSWTNVTELTLGRGGAVLASVNNTFMLSAELDTGYTRELLYLRSVDAGHTWHTAPAGVQQVVSAVNGRFVSSFYWFRTYIPGVTQVSNDLGLTWQSTDPGFTAEISDLKFADGAFVMVADDGLYFSYDYAVKWVKKSNISLTSVTYDVKHKRWYGTRPFHLSKYGHTEFAVANDVTRWDLIPGPVTPTYIELLAWELTAALLMPEGHWITVVVCAMQGTTNSSSSSSMPFPPSSASVSMRVYLSNSTGGWDFVNSTSLTLNVEDAYDVSLTTAHGITALEISGGIVVSYDGGRTWHIARDRKRAECTFVRGDNVWIDACDTPLVTYYAHESNVTNWREMPFAVPAWGLTWLPPNDKLREGQFVAGGDRGVVLRIAARTNFTAWQPAPPIDSLDTFLMWAASSSGHVVAVGTEDMIYTSDSFFDYE